MKINRFGLVLGVLALALGGCSGESVDPDLECNGKCDSTGSLYEAVMDKVNAVGKWAATDQNGMAPMTSIEDAYQVEMKLKGGKSLIAKTHMFGTQKVTLVPYANDDETKMPGTETPVRGDLAIAQVFAPGQVGYAIKHHRTEHRVLDLSSEAGPSGDMKENFKLNDTHIELVVGVMRDGQPGAMTINSPQDYERGLFGTIDYPMVFVKPIFPEAIRENADTTLAKKFNDNIRTMMVAFNAVSDFPGDYNGGDPLGAQSPERVKVMVANMILAIAGTGGLEMDARAWFEDELNQIYCAELAHVSSSAGMIVPLNWKNVEELQGLTLKGDEITAEQWASVWETFQGYIKAHNAGEETPFTTLNDNDRIHMVKLAPAADDNPDQVAGNIPATLMPAANYMVNFDDAKTRLAFQPMTMADIIRHFLRTHIPRDPEMEGTIAAVAKLNDKDESEVTDSMIEIEMAPNQGALLRSLEMGIYDAMGLVPKAEINGTSLQDMEEADQKKIGMRTQVVKPLFDAIAVVVETPFDNYKKFQDALMTTTLNREGHPYHGVPVMIAAQNLTGPRPGARLGEGLFVPPSLLHTIAQGAHTDGLLGLSYEGHGLHFSLVQPAGDAVATTTDAPADETEDDQPDKGSSDDDDNN